MPNIGGLHNEEIISPFFWYQSKLILEGWCIWEY